jgi:LPPG:FO 2-phospho-L-lactate transferase
VIAALAGGVGAARMLAGLVGTLPPADITAVVNTGDDLELHGLHISPDLDTVTYTLAGAVNAETGWGLTGETWRAMEALERYGGQTWFRLGDLDLATHLYRTQRRAEGAPLSQITRELAERMGVEARLMPMCDEEVATRITTPGGVRSFQEYLVRDGAAERIERIELVGIERARPAPGLLEAIAAAERIVICPSSPVVSIGTILAVPGVRPALAARRERTVAVSPIVGGRPVEGPADRFLAGAGYPECSAAQMARLYADVAGTFVLDRRDAGEAAAVEGAGARPVLLDALMPDRAARARLAAESLEALA